GNLRVLLPQAGGQARGRPPETDHGLDCHQPMGHVCQDVSRSKALDVLILDPLQEPGTRRAVMRVRGEVVDRRVGVQGDGRARGNLVKGHGASRMPNSSPSAICRRISGSPVHLSIPAVCSATLLSVWTVTLTFSCSCNGSGWSGLRTPFS